MFTGIIEALGTILHLENDQGNLIITIQSPISSGLKSDQSVSHDGVCLTVVEVKGDTHRVIAVQETLSRTTLQRWKTGQQVNLERAMVFGGRLDGHLVQGHVDETGTCLDIRHQDGSRLVTISFNPGSAHLLVNKGSVAINGISLTLIEPTVNQFSVAIIPYTWDHTTFHLLRKGDPVNLEFDIMGKYFARMMEVYPTIK